MLRLISKAEVSRLGKEVILMGLTKEKFTEIEDRISYMTEDQLMRIEHAAQAEIMSRDSRLDDFLCVAQADEVRIHQPASVSELITF